jgi:rhodanese-related sulfurtransferase
MRSGKTVIVYCGSGRRSEMVGTELAKKGYKVLNMGGFDSWKNAGLPVENK